MIEANDWGTVAREDMPSGRLIIVRIRLFFGRFHANQGKGAIE